MRQQLGLNSIEGPERVYGVNFGKVGYEEGE